eukprot:CAMPEP_0170585598 /NCGR_PEP_ID=MMETSP0224-20130122/9300_1 /TAXON_ID=285029 /ORGANISM="Togula jolla, Strain CCCM 725" /LENGTH=43 /DNA_ID= /DNA_START= /DNA_END= /DNA_ORIENTATION=
MTWISPEAPDEPSKLELLSPSSCPPWRLYSESKMSAGDTDLNL